MAIFLMLTITIVAIAVNRSEPLSSGHIPNLTDAQSEKRRLVAVEADSATLCRSCPSIEDTYNFSEGT